MPRDYVIERAKTVGSPDFVPLERFQVLMLREVLVKMTFTIEDMLKGKMRHIGAASYAWEGAGDPDPEGERLLQHAKFLQENPDVEFMFIDYPCLPQEFRESLKDPGAKQSLVISIRSGFE